MGSWDGIAGHLLSVKQLSVKAKDAHLYLASWGFWCPGHIWRLVLLLLDLL